MKIKLSKSQWEEIGKKTGWIKITSYSSSTVESSLQKHPFIYAILSKLPLFKQAILIVENIISSDNPQNIFNKLSITENTINIANSILHSLKRFSFSENNTKNTKIGTSVLLDPSNPLSPLNPSNPVSPFFHRSFENLTNTPLNVIVCLIILVVAGWILVDIIKYKRWR